MVKKICQSGLTLLQENHHTCYDHRGGDSPAALAVFWYGSLPANPGVPLSFGFRLQQEQQSSFCCLHLNR